MMIKANGIMYIEFRPECGTKEEQTVKYDNRFGAGNWKFSKQICSYLEPSCGYGPENITCKYYSGACNRPTKA